MVSLRSPPNSEGSDEQEDHTGSDGGVARAAVQDHWNECWYACDPVAGLSYCEMDFDRAAQARPDSLSTGACRTKTAIVFNQSVGPLLQVEHKPLADINLIGTDLSPQVPGAGCDNFPTDEVN